MEVILSSMDFFFIKTFSGLPKNETFLSYHDFVRRNFLKSFNLQQLEDFVFKAVFIVEQRKLVSM